MMLSRFSKRAWGWYFTLIDANHFKVKLLRFNNGSGCSWQSHKYRNELWLFLSGNGMMGIFKYPYSEKKKEMSLKLVKCGDYKHIPIGQIHHFIGTAWILEIQYGDVCSEEDIIRL